jgi:hypothetical protein
LVPQSNSTLNNHNLLLLKRNRHYPWLKDNHVNWILMELSTNHVLFVDANSPLTLSTPHTVFHTTTQPFSFVTLLLSHITTTLQHVFPVNQCNITLNVTLCSCFFLPILVFLCYMSRFFLPMYITLLFLCLFDSQCFVTLVS